MFFKDSGPSLGRQFAEGCGFVAVAFVWFRIFGLDLPTAAAGSGLFALFILFLRTLLPKGIELSESEIRIVRRLAPALRIPLSNVVGVQEGPAEIRPPLSMGGGTYAKGVGRLRYLGTGARPGVLILRLRGLPVVVTPVDPAGFLREVWARLPWDSTQTGSEAGAR